MLENSYEPLRVRCRAADFTFQYCTTLTKHAGYFTLTVSKLPCRLRHWQFDPPAGIPCGSRRCCRKRRLTSLDLGLLAASLYGRWVRRWTELSIDRSPDPTGSTSPHSLWSGLQRRWISVSRVNEISCNFHQWFHLLVSQRARHKCGTDFPLTQIIEIDAVHSALVQCCLSFCLLTLDPNVADQEFPVRKCLNHW